MDCNQNVLSKTRRFRKYPLALARQCTEALTPRRWQVEPTGTYGKSGTKLANQKAVLERADEWSSHGIPLGWSQWLLLPRCRITFLRALLLSCKIARAWLVIPTLLTSEMCIHGLLAFLAPFRTTDRQRRHCMQTVWQTYHCWHRFNFGN